MNTGVGCHFLLQGISPTQGLLHCRQILYRLSSKGSPRWLRNAGGKGRLSFPPPWEFQTPISSLRAPDPAPFPSPLPTPPRPTLPLGDPDFLSTYLGIDSLTSMATTWTNQNWPGSPSEWLLTINNQYNCVGASWLTSGIRLLLHPWGNWSL